MDCKPASTNPKSARWIVPLLLLGPIVAIFAPVLFADRSFAFRDGAHFYHPLFQWITAEWGQGRVPLWNPQENCGLPVLADATSSIFYPGKLIFTLPLPFVWLYKFYIIGHVVLAALGMFAFARRLRASEQTAVLVAIAYACGGNVVFQYCNVIFLVGAAWLPFALLAIETIVSSRCWRAMLFLAFVLAMMILGGDPQMALHVLLAAGLRIAASLASILRGESREEGLTLVQPSIFQQLTPSAALLAGAAILAFLLAAVQIFPSSEATKSSERAAYNRPRNIFEAAAVLTTAPESESLLAETPSEKVVAGLFGQPEPSSHHDRAYDYSISPWRVAEFVWPNVSGKPFPRNQRWTSLIPGESKPWTPTLYLGLLPFLAGVAALRWWRTDATTRWLTWLVIVFTLGSFGWYGLGWLLRECYSTILHGDPAKLGIGSPVGGVYWLMVTFLPSYIYFRYPAKLMVVAVCALLAIAAPAADRLFEKKSERWLLTFKTITIASMVIAFSVWCISPQLLKLPPSPSQIFGPFEMSGALFDVFTALAHTTLIAALSYWLLTKIWEAAATSDGQAITRLKWAAVVITATEVVVANGNLILTAPAKMWNSEPAIVSSIQAREEREPENRRTIQPRFFRGSYRSWNPPSFAKAGASRRIEEMATWDHDTLSHKYFLPSGLSLVESYGSLKPVDYESLLLQARALSPTKVDGVSQPLSEALRLTACEYLVLPGSAKIPYAENLHATNLPENSTVWRMKRILPRAHVVDQIITLPPLADSLDLAAVDARALLVLAETSEGKTKIRDFRTLAVVETKEKLSLPVVDASSEPAASKASAQIVLGEPQHVRVQATLEKPGLLVLSDSWNAGWVATRQPADSPVGSQTTPLTIHRTNRCFRGVQLPEGAWQVDFEYRPQSFYCGGVVSMVAWLGLIAVVIVSSLRSRKNSC
ncbi:hypothetical protein [Anatilimnocola floriformis]|uniref:hypothetical protein n=1 Tax=Anatilimnocola floriformis TaxID=2948575 RepID=UPI0020C43D15|nr:hypothetical protein [Anatilimnocola floriformis]